MFVRADFGIQKCKGGLKYTVSKNEKYRLDNRHNRSDRHKNCSKIITEVNILRED